MTTVTMWVSVCIKNNEVLVTVTDSFLARSLTDCQICEYQLKSVKNERAQVFFSEKKTNKKLI